MSKTTPPQPDELEISLFGPGYGESTLVHLGSGNWMIVDSCLDESGEKAIALDSTHRETSSRPRHGYARRIRSIL